MSEGGQIINHRARMFKQVIRIALTFAVLATGFHFLYKMASVPSLYYQSAWYYAKASLLQPMTDQVFVSPTFWNKVSNKSYGQKKVMLRPDQVLKACKSPTFFLINKAEEALKKSILTFVLIFLSTLLLFFFKGLMSRKKIHVEGQTLSSPWKIALKLKITGQASSIKLGSLPLVKGSETRHILVSGGSGSGKTNCFHHILPQIRDQKQRAIIVDTTGTFVEKYYRPDKDILLNPFDQRSVSWHPWCECKEVYDYESLAQSFIPSTHNADEDFWRNSAQAIFSSALQIKAEERKTSELLRLMLFESLPVLYHALESTEAAPFLDPASEKTAGSIRSVAASFVRCLKYFDDTKTPFSIRDWVLNEKDDSWLFLTATPSQRTSLNPLLSSWFSIAMRSLFQMPEDLHRRLWFVADELPKLNKLRDLEGCLTESRKFGGCALLAIQSPAQLETIYGLSTSKILIGNCATRIVFSEQSSEIAYQISRAFGEKETKEYQEAISYGAHEMRDGVNISLQSRKSQVVTPTSLMSLSPNQAFVKLAGNLPITKIKLGYRELPKISEGFLAKKKMPIDKHDECMEILSSGWESKSFR